MVETAGVLPKMIQEIRMTDPMVILREKGRIDSSCNLLIRTSAHNIIRTCTVLPLQEINTVERDMKRQSMVCINNTPCDYDGCR